MSNRSAENPAHTAHLTKIIDKEGKLIFVQISAQLWENISPLVEPQLQEELEKLHRQQKRQEAQAKSPLEDVETIQAEELGNDTFVRKRFKDATQRSHEVQQYLDALRQKINEHRPAR